MGFWWHWVCTSEKKQQVFSVSWCGNRQSGSALTILSSRVVLMIDQRSSRCCISITTSFSLKMKIVLNAMNEAVELGRSKPLNKSERRGRDRFFLFSGCLDQKKFKCTENLLMYYTIVKWGQNFLSGAKSKKDVVIRRLKVVLVRHSKLPIKLPFSLWLYWSINHSFKLTIDVQLYWSINHCTYRSIHLFIRCRPWS